jgi:hypothetical protein
MANYQPLYTCVGAARLGEDDVRVEIEAEVYDPKGAENAKQQWLDCLIVLAEILAG